MELRMSGSSLFHSLMTLGMKEFLKYSDLQETVLNELTCRRELLIIGVNHKCRVADQLKKLYRVSTIFSLIFDDKDIPVLTPGTIFHKRSL